MKILMIILCVLFLAVGVIGASCIDDIIHETKFVEFRGGQIDKQFWKDNQGETIELSLCKNTPCPEPYTKKYIWKKGTTWNSCLKVL